MNLNAETYRNLLLFITLKAVVVFWLTKMLKSILVFRTLFLCLQEKKRTMETIAHLINIVVHVTLINIVFCNFKFSDKFIETKWFLQKLYSMVSAIKQLAWFDRTLVVVSFKACNTWFNAWGISPMLVQKSLCPEENLQANKMLLYCCIHKLCKVSQLNYYNILLFYISFIILNLIYVGK